MENLYASVEKLLPLKVVWFFIGVGALKIILNLFKFLAIFIPWEALYFQQNLA